MDPRATHVGLNHSMCGVANRIVFLSHCMCGVPKTIVFLSNSMCGVAKRMIVCLSYIMFGVASLTIWHTWVQNCVDFQNGY